MHNKTSLRRWRNYVRPFSKLHDKESLFIWEIDANVPYKNKHLVRRLIKEALSLSPEATFTMIFELCNIGGSWQSQLLKRRFAWKSLNMIPRYFSHPLLDIVMDSANTDLQQKDLPMDEALRRMEIVRQYPKSYSALQIVAFNSPDDDGIIDETYDAILAEWHSK